MNEVEREKYLKMIGCQIKQFRIALGLSQDDLAKKCGYTSRSSINKIELGFRDISQSSIKAIADALGVSVSDLLCLDKPDGTNVPDSPRKEISLPEFIEQKYGTSVKDAFSLFTQLDAIDQGRIIGNMEIMLEQKKYTGKKGTP